MSVPVSVYTLPAKMPPLPAPSTLRCTMNTWSPRLLLFHRLKGPCRSLLLLFDWLGGLNEPMSIMSVDGNVDRAAPKSKGCVWRVVKAWLSFEKAATLNVLMCSSPILTSLCSWEAQACGLWHSFLPHSYKTTKSADHLREFRTDFLGRSWHQVFPDWEVYIKLFNLYFIRTTYWV